VRNLPPLVVDHMTGTLCLATPPGYAELPARCHLTRGHNGNHTAHKPATGPAETWTNLGDDKDAA
jgi:hypothetical protein